MVLMLRVGDCLDECLIAWRAASVFRRRPARAALPLSHHSFAVPAESDDLVVERPLVRELSIAGPTTADDTCAQVAYPFEQEVAIARRDRKVVNNAVEVAQMVHRASLPTIGPIKADPSGPRVILNRIVYLDTDALLDTPERQDIGHRDTSIR
ncbi:MAG: hypothetical protein RIB84_20595 [Sneathiellaceae bacterium]